MKTYSCRNVKLALGNHSASGFADDSFITIEPKGDGVTSKTGCDGEVTRAIDPNQQYIIKLSLNQMSPTDKYLRGRYNTDKKYGKGTFSVLLTDASGKLKFSASDAWVVKPPSRVYGKDTNNLEYEIETGPADFKNT